MRKHEPVSRLMTAAVLSVGVEEPAGEVLRLFREYPVHHLPVVEDRRVVGVLSSAEMLKLRALVPKSVVSAEAYLNERMKVRALISRPAVTIAQHDTVERAAELMAAHAIHSLPVVDAAGHLVGILTTTDIIGAMFDAAPASFAAPSIAHAQEARLTLEQRIALLERVATLAARYLTSDQDAELRAALGKAIEQARAIPAPAGGAT